LTNFSLHKIKHFYKFASCRPYLQVDICSQKTETTFHSCRLTGIFGLHFYDAKTYDTLTVVFDDIIFSNLERILNTSSSVGILMLYVWGTLQNNISGNGASFNKLETGIFDLLLFSGLFLELYLTLLASNLRKGKMI